MGRAAATICSDVINRFSLRLSAYICRSFALFGFNRPLLGVAADSKQRTLSIVIRLHLSKISSGRRLHSVSDVPNRFGSNTDKESAVYEVRLNDTRGLLL